MKSARTMAILMFGVVLGMFALAAWQWPMAPERIPTHWNIHGEVDGWSGKFGGLLLIPLIGLGLFALFVALPWIDPKKENYEGSGAAYRLVFLSVMVFMAAFQVLTVLSMRGWNVSVGKALPGLVGLLFMALGSVMGKVKSNWFMGVRTPWTLSSELSWERTHRAAAWVFFLAGLATVLASPFSPLLTFAVLFCGAVGGSVALVVYSYVVWKRDPLKR